MNYPYLLVLSDKKQKTILNEKDFLELVKEYMGEYCSNYLEQYMLETQDWYNTLIKIDYDYDE